MRRAKGRVKEKSYCLAMPWVVRGVGTVFESTTANSDLYGWAMRSAFASAHQPSLSTSTATVEDAEGTAVALGLDAPEVLDLL